MAWQNAFELLLLSVIRTVRLVVPSMRARGGGAILVGTSSTVKEPFPNLALSNVMRAGVTSLVKTLSVELAAGSHSRQLAAAGTDCDRSPDAISTRRTRRRPGITAEEQRQRGDGDDSGRPLRRAGRVRPRRRVPAVGRRVVHHRRGAAGRRRPHQGTLELRIADCGLRIRSHTESASANERCSRAARTNALAARARDQHGVRAAIGVDLHAGRAARGCDGRGGGAAGAGHRHDFHQARREPDARRGRRGGHAALSRRPRQGEGGRAARADLGQADAARPRSRPGAVLPQSAAAGRSRRASATTSSGSTWRARPTSIRRSICSAARARARRASASRCRRICIAPRTTSSRWCRSASAIRLVKGAYLEPASVAYPKKADVDENFYALSCRLLAEDARTAGGLLHMATHDPVLVDRLTAFIDAAARAEVRLRVRDALRHPAAAAAAAGRAAAARSACWSPTASTGSPGTCAASPSVPPTSGSSSRMCFGRRDPGSGRFGAIRTYNIRMKSSRLLLGLLFACLVAVSLVAQRRGGAQPDGLVVPLPRSGRRQPRRGDRRRPRRSVDLLRRRGVGRRLEDDRRRHPLGAGVRQHAGRGDRRARRRAVRSERSSGPAPARRGRFATAT